MAEQQRLRELSEEYEKIQGELSENVQARQKLESQYTENKSVQKEFSELDSESKVYKLVGPVLLKQDSAEAKSTVESRIGYIETEIKRIEVKIKDLQQTSERKRTEIMQVQSQMPQQPQQQQGAAAPA